MEFKAFGDQAVLINFAQKIDADVNAEVIQLKNAIEKAEIPGVSFCIPAYCSLTVGYDPLRLHFDQLCKTIKGLRISKTKGQQHRKLTIPVCYENSFGIDFEELMEQTKLSKEAIIKLHTSTTFQVYMLGFLPGFPYMGKLPEALFCKRKAVPRLKVPAGSVGLAGHQTGIYPAAAPGGWQIIGKTPLQVLDTEKENPFLFRAGDLIKFKAVSYSNFKTIKKDIARGDFDLNSIYE